MAAPRTLCIAVAAAMAALPPAAEAAKLRPLAPGPGCPRPVIRADVDYPAERVTYDLERHPDFKREGRPLGLFSASHRVQYGGSVQKGCLRDFAVTIEVTPQIHLRSVYTRKSKKCARQLVLDHERGHGRVARDEYKKLAANIEKTVAGLFGGKQVPDVKTAEAHLKAALDGGVLKAFSKRYDAAQAKFHGQLAQADIIKKKCRLVKRKR